MAEPIHLVDVNVLVARLFEDHEHHRAAAEWFDTPGLQWALCAWAEAGFLRFATRNGRLDMGEATVMLEELERRPGSRYQPIAHTWRTLTEPFFPRLHGHKQVTDACLLGLAIREGLVLATFDRRILHLAGEHRRHVHVVTVNPEP